MYDQSVSNTSPPQEIGVFRTLDHGDTWRYQGAGYATGYRFVDADGDAWATCSDYRVDSTLDRPIEPFGTTSGRVFNDGSSSTANASWGNPTAVAALDEYTAVVLFSSFTLSGTEYPGRIAYTVDGGTTWNQVTFDGDWDEDSTVDPTDCDAYDTFNTATGLALLASDSTGLVTVVGASSQATGRLQGSDKIVLYLSSRQNGSLSSTDSECGLARIEITAGATSDTYDWDWVQMVRSFTSDTVCRVDENNIAGIAASPWPPTSSTPTDKVEELFTWAELEYSTTWSKFVGGACAVTRTETNTGTVSYSISQVVSPDSYPASIGEVAPSPYVTDTILVAMEANLQALHNYTASGASTTLEMPNAWPLWGQRAATNWTLYELDSDDLPNLVGTAAAWGMNRDEAGEVDVYLGTEGSGTWWTPVDDGDTGTP
jgi:hypothetical protein